MDIACTRCGKTVDPFGPNLQANFFSGMDTKLRQYPYHLCEKCTKEFIMNHSNYCENGRPMGPSTKELLLEPYEYIEDDEE